MYTLKEVVGKLGVPYGTVYHQLWRGVLKDSTKFVGTRRVYDDADVARFQEHFKDWKRIAPRKRKEAG